MSKTFLNKRRWGAFCLTLLLLYPAKQTYGAYVGGSVFCQAARPKLHWSDPLVRWFTDSVAKAGALLGSFYSTPDREIIQKEAFFNRTVLARNEERILLDNWFYGPGGNLWFGNGKKLKDRFYVGYDLTIGYAHLDIGENSNGTPLIQFENPTFFYRHGLSGESVYAAHIQVTGHLSAHTSVCIGYTPLSKIFTYVKVGFGGHHYVFDKFTIHIQNDISVQRYLDPGNNDSPTVLLLEDLPQSVDYHLSSDRHFSASLDLGLGCDVSFSKNWFMRVEYLFSFFFSNHLHAFSDQDIDYTQPCYEYSLKYQNLSHRFSIGLGRHF